MSIYIWILAVLLGLLGEPLRAEVKPDAQIEGHQNPDQPAGHEATILPEAFYPIERQSVGGFIGERRAFLHDLPGRIENGARTNALMDMAEIYLAFGMAQEGLSTLSGIDPQDLSQKESVLLARLQLALGVIDARNLPLTAGAEMLLAEQYAAWPDQPLFLAMTQIRAGRFGDIGGLLDPALQILDRFPAPVRALMLPALLDAAVETQQWQIAREFARRFEDHPTLRRSNAYNFLRGRTAEGGGDLLEAFDSYRAASGGRDLWAHRARMALVSLGVTSGTLATADARVLLEQAQRQWKGDSYARETLRRLADAQEADHDPLATVLTLGDLATTYPVSAEANAEQPRAEQLLAQIYDAGSAGELPLSEFLLAHRRIAVDFRFAPAFASNAEQFADKFLDAGSTKIAADEYGEIRDFLAVMQDLGMIEKDALRLDRILLKQLNAHLLGSNHEAAASVIRVGLLSDDAGVRDALNAAAAQLYSEGSLLDDVINTEVSMPTRNYLRIKARAYFDKEDWAAAASTYQQLWADYGPELTIGDAGNLMLAAHRNGNSELVRSMAARFPELTDHPNWVEIAAGLTNVAPELLPLRNDSARARLLEAGQALDRLGQSPEAAGQ